MASSGVVRIKEVWRMLDQCAPGHSKKATDHHWRIRWNDKLYPAFPLGPHGARENPEIGLEHVRKLSRFLGILECAETQIEHLTGGKARRPKEAEAE